MTTYADILPQLLETLTPYAKKVGNLKETTDLVSELGPRFPSSHASVAQNRRPV